MAGAVTMHSDRLLFILLAAALGFPAVIVVGIIPRLQLPVMVVIAAVYSATVVGRLTVASIPVYLLLLAFTGAVAAASLILALALKVRSPLRDAWQVASRPLRVVVFTFLAMLVAATARTLLAGDFAAGTAVVVGVWFLALSGGFRSLSRSAAPPIPSGSLLLTLALLALGAALLSVQTIGGTGQVDVILAVAALAALALGCTPRLPLLRLTFLALAALLTVSLIIFYPRSQSLLGAVLFGGVWMCIAASLRRTGKLRKRRKLLVVLVLATILVFPLLAIFKYYGLPMGVVDGAVDWGIEALGETMLNVLNRPERWQALLAEIGRHPLNLRFTNFANIFYTPGSGLQAVAAPHNVLITLGVFLGIPGMVLATVLIAALIGSILKAVVRSNQRTRPVALAAFGIVCGLLFRGMWSNGLLTWPIEITLFGLATLAAWQVDSTASEAV